MSSWPLTKHTELIWVTSRMTESSKKFDSLQNVAFFAVSDIFAWRSWTYSSFMHCRQKEITSVFLEEGRFPWVMCKLAKFITLYSFYALHHITHYMICLQPDINMPDAPKCMAWCKDSIILGFKRDYHIVTMRPNAVPKELFPTGN